MAISTAVSVGAFSVVLTQSFVAVAASTIVPAVFLTAARAARAAAAAGDASGADTGNALVTSAPGVSEVMAGLRSGIAQVDEIDLLVPKSARIEAEFEFEASEEYAANASLGAMVQVVSVSAGYSALYQTATRNKIRLEVDFAVVNYRIAPDT